ncbi:MAG: hypothetical protein ABIQ73_02880 [Acidimicrobiales bacterium]
MKVTGAVITASDSAQSDAEAYGQWLGAVRRPAIERVDGVAAVRHYRADAALQALRGPNPVEAFAPGNGAFLEVCLLTGDDPATAIEGLQRLSSALAAPAALGETIRFRESFEMRWAMGRIGLAEAEDALANAPHRGIQFALGEVADEAMRPVIADWYSTTHAPDALLVGGFLAALRMTSLETPGRHLVIFLLDDEPAECIRRIREAVPDWRSRGRTPSPGGASRAVVNGPFALL